MGERCALRTLEDVEFSMPLFLGGGGKSRQGVSKLSYIYA